MRAKATILPGSVRVSVMPDYRRATSHGGRISTPQNEDDAEEKERFAQSITRAKRVLRDIVDCNSWDWFATFTFDPNNEKVKACDDVPQLCVKFLKSVRTKYKAQDMKWLLVPEPSENMKDNRLHVHGLLANVPQEAIHVWTEGDKDCPDYLRFIVKGRTRVAEFPAYGKKYGFNWLFPIYDVKRLEYYLIKSMGFATMYRGKGQHLYYASRNVQRPVQTKTVLCSNRMYDKMSDIASDSYAHKSKDGETVFGKTFLLPYNVETGVFLAQLFGDDL